MKTFKYRYEAWDTPLPGGYSVKDNEIGTIRTVPENYFVASVFIDLSIKFDPLMEARTRDVDQAGVTKWWNILKPTLNVARVTVVNLSTGAERVYMGLTPAQAVVAAHEQADRGNFNTWNYDWTKAKVSDSRETVACGDWTAKYLTEFLTASIPRKGPEMTRGRR